MNNTAMLIGLVAGLLLGLIASLTGSEFLIDVSMGVQPLGTIFINAVRMVVIPLVAATIFVGVCKLGDPRKLGKLGGSTLGFFWGTTIPAIALGMLFMGFGLRFAPRVEVPAGVEEVARELPGFVDFLVRLIPPNPFAAAAEGALLPLIVFTILFAAAASTLSEDKKNQLIGLAEGISDTLIRLVHWVLWTAPVGIFGLSAPATASAGPALLKSMGIFIVVVALGTFVFMGLVYLPLVAVVGRMSPAKFIKGTLGTYAIGFSSTSSVASFPVMFEDAERLGVSETVASLTLSLGAALNRAGTGLFQGASIVFLAYLFDVSLGGTVIASAFIATFFVTMTVAPVPSAGVVTLAPALEAAGIPLAGMALLLGIDRIPDMFRSATNITGHVAGAVVVDQLMGEADAEVLESEAQEALARAAGSGS
jgi:Na+/H+-dicarboxylate symporter